ncbi:MAG: hypothetical protein RLZZ142_960 [Verrucomicrobiota bacterium]
MVLLTASEDCLAQEGRRDPVRAGDHLPEQKERLAGPESSPEGEPKAVEKKEGTPSLPPLSIPLVVGFPSFGLRLPDLDDRGRLRNLFVLGAVEQMNEQDVQIKQSLLETYNDDGSRSLSIDLPEAILNRFTRMLVSKVPVTIRTDDFELKGAGLEYDTVRFEGELRGPVKMVLYNAQIGDAAGRPKASPSK